MSSNFLRSSSNIKIQKVSKNQGLNEKETITCPQTQMLYMPACRLFISQLIFNVILTGLFTSFFSLLKIKRETAKGTPSDSSDK